MKTTGTVKGAALAAAGAVLLGGGMFLGFVSALVRRKPEGRGPLAEVSPALSGPPLAERVEELAQSVADLQKRIETAAAPKPQEEAVTEKLEAVSLRVEQLERRVEQLASEAPPIPPIDQILAAVEHMVSVKISGLDDRLTDQVHAIELLRSASTQTDMLLQKLIDAVEALGGHPAGQTEVSGEGEPEAPPDYPIA
jgi:type II secretory pathway component PulM